MGAFLGAVNLFLLCVYSSGLSFVAGFGNSEIELYLSFLFNLLFIRCLCVNKAMCGLIESRLVKGSAGQFRQTAIHCRRCTFVGRIGSLGARLTIGQLVLASLSSLVKLEPIAITCTSFPR